MLENQDTVLTRMGILSVNSLQEAKFFKFPDSLFYYIKEDQSDMSEIEKTF